MGSSTNQEAGKHRILLAPNAEVQRILAIAFKGVGESDKTLALMPPENEMRMFLQAGRVTIHGSSRSLLQRAENPSFLARFEIPSKAKPLLLHQLDVVGICRSTLFPDLDSLAADVAARSWGSPEPAEGNT